MDLIHQPQPVLGRYANEAILRKNGRHEYAPLSTLNDELFMIAYDGLKFIHTGHTCRIGATINAKKTR